MKENNLLSIFGFWYKTLLPSRFHDTFFKIGVCLISLPKLPRIFIGALLAATPPKYQNQIHKKTKAIWFFGGRKTKLFGFWWVEKPNGLVFRGSKNQNGLVFGRSKNQNGLGSWMGGSQAPGVRCAFAVVSSVACNVWHERASLRISVGWPWVGGWGFGGGLCPFGMFTFVL